MKRRITSILCLLLAGASHAADEPKTPPAKAPELRAELLRRAKADQDVRGAIAQWMIRFGNGDVGDEAAFEASLDAARKAEFRRLGQAMNRVDA